MDPKSGQTNNSPVAKLITLNLLLAAVEMRFWQNGGQTNNSRKGQKVDKLITLRHAYIYIYISLSLSLSLSSLSSFASTHAEDQRCGGFHSGSPAIGPEPFLAWMWSESFCQTVSMLTARRQRGDMVCRFHRRVCAVWWPITRDGWSKGTWAAFFEHLHGL